MGENVRVAPSVMQGQRERGGDKKSANFSPFSKEGLSVSHALEADDLVYMM